MILREAIAVIVGIFFVFTLWVAITDTDYDKHYLIRGVKPPKALYVDGKDLQRAGYDGYFRERDYWHLPKVQEWAKKLAKIKFPNAEMQKKFGIYQIKLDGEWKNIACSPDGKYLYIGWEPTPRQKRMCDENSEYYRNNWNQEKKHLKCL